MLIPGARQRLPPTALASKLRRTSIAGTASTVPSSTLAPAASRFITAGSRLRLNSSGPTPSHSCLLHFPSGLPGADEKVLGPFICMFTIGRSDGMAAWPPVTNRSDTAHRSMDETLLAGRPRRHHAPVLQQTVFHQRGPVLNDKSCAKGLLPACFSEGYALSVTRRLRRYCETNATSTRPKPSASAMMPG